MAVNKDNIKWGSGVLQVQEYGETIFDVGACKDFEVVYTKELISVECGQQMGTVLMGAVADACEVNVILQEESWNNLQLFLGMSANGGAGQTYVTIGGEKTVSEYILTFTPTNPPPLHSSGKVLVYRAIVTTPARIKFSKKEAREFPVKFKCLPNVSSLYVKYGYQIV